MSEMEPCGVCHALHRYEDLACFNDTLIWADDDQGNEDSGHLCQSCYDRYYNTCDECHRIICEEDAYYEDDDTVRRSRFSLFFANKRQPKAA